MRVRFWGTRGSIACGDPDYMKYGGNTTCVEVRTAGGEVVIFDAGTGIRRLGFHLLKDPSFRRRGYLFLTHFHWDHIQGFPFFTPAFDPSCSFVIHGQFKMGGRLEESLRGQMEHNYFPVKMEAMGARIDYRELIEETVDLPGGARVTARLLNHPQGCFGYRVEDAGRVFVFATDTEPRPDQEVDGKLVELAHGADLLAMDAQYTPEEYPAKVGWGHSTWLDCVKVARAAGVRRVLLTHHDPGHDDAFVDGVVRTARAEFAGLEAAARDMEVALEADRPAAPGPARVTRSVPVKAHAIERSEGLLRVRAPSTVEGLCSPEFRQEVERAMAEDAIREVVVDLAPLEEIDSTALGVLASLYKHAEGQGLAFAVARPRPLVREVLIITRFSEVAPIRDLA